MSTAGHRPDTCVVFDIDDTLYLERSYVRSGFDAVDRYLTAVHGVRGFGAVCWRLFEDGVRSLTFDIAAQRLGVRLPPATIAELVEVYRSHEPAIELLADAAAAIDALRDAGVFVAVVTDGPLASQRAKARVLGAERWADLVVCTAALGPGMGKPHPRAFELVEAACGLGGWRCTYVADNVHKDFVAPRSMGWRTVRVRRAGGLHESLGGGADVDVELADLAGLPALIDTVMPLTTAGSSPPVGDGG